MNNDGGGEGHLPFTCLKAHRNFDLFKISFPSFYIRKGPVPKPLTIEHQCAYSSYCSIYISWATNKENSFINQELLWVAIISSFSNLTVWLRAYTVRRNYVLGTLNPFAPKISSVILSTVCHTILMMLVRRIWYKIN